MIRLKKLQLAKTKIILGAWLVLLTHISYAQSSTSQPKATLTLHSQSDFTITDNTLAFTEGEQTILSLTVIGPGDKRIDAGMDKTLVISMPANKDLSIDDWENYKAFIEISGCRCFNRGFNTITNGTLTISKLDNSRWSIFADLKATGRDNNEPILFYFEGEIKASVP